MKKMINRKVAFISAILLTAILSTAFLVNQESRDFRIGKNLDIFFSLFRELNTFYVDEINPDKIIRTGIDNMLKSLDPYTVYYSESEVDDFSLLTTGKYGGIGCLVRNGGDFAVIVQVYKGFPADLAGIKVGDMIRKVNGISLKGFSTDNVSDKLKGDPGSEVRLTLERDGKETDITMKRARIAVPAVTYYGMLDEKTGYIRFSSFTQNSVEEVKKALIVLKAKNPQSVILDLRGNPGGLLTEAVEIVNLFVGAGSEVVSTRGKVKQFDAVYKTTSQAVDEKISLAIITNRGSASASEIVAGAIQDLDRGVIVGQRSYGKGLVQISRPLSYNTQIKLTTAKYYIPSGRCIQALDFTNPNEDGSVGVIPDSLISEFKTKNGRIVKDGGGITPDVEIISETLSQVATELYLRNFIFDYATQYFRTHPDIKSLEQLSYSDKDYESFRKFLKDRNFSYTTYTEQSISELIDNAKREKYYEMHKELFSALEKDLSHSLDNDLTTFRKEIQELIEAEILSRYFYEDGSIAWTVKSDLQIIKAMEVVNNKELYTSILAGKKTLLTKGEKVKMFAGDEGTEKAKGMRLI